MVAESAFSRLKSRAQPISLFPVTDDIAGLRIFMVNAYFVGDPNASDHAWVLVDAGLPYSAGRILSAAHKRFGPDAAPLAIVLTHGHFDHVGAVKELAEYWDVPVYAHPQEMPYLTGQTDYPPPDPTVGGGMMAYMAGLYPSKAINLGTRVQALPEDGRVPFLDHWRWIHTPGHTEGHVSLFRDLDRVVLAGDAFITTNQESTWSVLTQRPVIHGPPTYYTPDWAQAKESVEKLAHLVPLIAATGHGMPMRGEKLEQDLHRLAENFDQMAVPSQGRYVHEYDPERPSAHSALTTFAKEAGPKALVGLGIAAGAVAGWWSARPRRKP
jgi:glyoxylase-like metal-dependent hydrolase (beta-lactamase superfamily II)